MTHSQARERRAKMADRFSGLTHEAPRGRLRVGMRDHLSTRENANGPRNGVAFLWMVSHSSGVGGLFFGGIMT